MPVYVQHEVLGQIPDVFNAEALWQAPGLALFSRRPLLRDLLERAPREQRGRAATRCFSHVTLVLAQDEVDDDRHLTRGARVRDLAQTLAALHQKDFGDLLGADEVRYDVVGADTLEPGQVQVKFGHAVYLPAAGEIALYNVATSLDGVLWKPACPIYPNQRLALIGQDAAAASHAVAGWPFGAGAAILLVNDGADAPIEVQMRPKQALECSFDAVNDHYVIRAKAGDGARLLMKVTRTGAPAAVPMPQKTASVWQARSVVDAETALPHSLATAAAATDADAGADATYAPVTQAPAAQVSLVALALPRLSRYRETGAVSLDIGLDSALALAAPGQAAFSFSVDAADALHVVTASGREAISAPASFTPPGGGAIELVTSPSAMQERYCAMLRLPHALAAPVARGARFVFGRGAPVLAALRVLDSPRFLRNADGQDGASADRIGLSRNAFSFELTGASYQIVRQSATQALYHLDDKLTFVAHVGDKPYVLPAGHHLVAGHYVLRFDA